MSVALHYHREHEAPQQIGYVKTGKRTRYVDGKKVVEHGFYGQMTVGSTTLYSGFHTEPLRAHCEALELAIKHISGDGEGTCQNHSGIRPSPSPKAEQVSSRISESASSVAASGQTKSSFRLSDLLEDHPQDLSS